MGLNFMYTKTLKNPHAARPHAAAGRCGGVGVVRCGGSSGSDGDGGAAAAGAVSQPIHQYPAILINILSPQYCEVVPTLEIHSNICIKKAGHLDDLDKMRKFNLKIY